jgi:2-phosphoglycerate kinase
MIYLIGGPVKCGKTTLAKRLSKAIGVPWMSTDSLQGVVKPYLNESELVAQFPASQQRSKSNDEKYSKYSLAEILQAYQTQAQTLYPAVKGLIECELADGHDLILEGYHLEPRFCHELGQKYPGQIRSIFLVKTDVQKLTRDLKKSTTPNDWVLSRTAEEATFGKIAEMICEYSRYFIEQAQDYGLTVQNLDEDFDSRIDRIVEEEMQNLRES